MKRELIGRKKGMTQYMQEDGTVIPVTVCELGPCVVVQKKTDEVDGYSALKVGFLDQKESRLTKSVRDDLGKKGISAKRYLREVAVSDDAVEVGAVIDCSLFNDGDVVSVTGTSKGRGFAGVIKRYGFGGGRATHGSHFHRSPGSIGACATPGEVWKGQKMPGRLGSDKVTIKNLKIVKVLKEKNIVLVSGSVPGTRDSLITVSSNK